MNENDRIIYRFTVVCMQREICQAVYKDMSKQLEDIKTFYSGDIDQNGEPVIDTSIKKLQPDFPNPNKTFSIGIEVRVKDGYNLIPFLVPEPNHLPKTKLESMDRGIISLYYCNIECNNRDMNFVSFHLTKFDLFKTKKIFKTVSAEVNGYMQLRFKNFSCRPVFKVANMEIDKNFGGKPW